jgi:hypothetical protein
MHPPLVGCSGLLGSCVEVHRQRGMVGISRLSDQVVVSAIGETGQDRLTSESVIEPIRIHWA